MHRNRNYLYFKYIIKKESIKNNTKNDCFNGPISLNVIKHANHSRKRCTTNLLKSTNYFKYRRNKFLWKNQTWY